MLKENYEKELSDIELVALRHATSIKNTWIAMLVFFSMWMIVAFVMLLSQKEEWKSNYETLKKEAITNNVAWYNPTNGIFWEWKKQ